MSTETATALRRAADAIRRRGWTRGTLQDAKGRVCLVGSLDAAIGVDWTARSGHLWQRAFTAIVRYLGGSGWREPALWNDRPGRTAEQVIRLLEAVADQEDARAGVVPQPVHPDEVIVGWIDPTGAGRGNWAELERIAATDPLLARALDGDR